MFEVPDAKRIRRDELYGSSSDAEDHSQADAEEDAEIRAKLNERLSSLLGLDLSSAAAAAAAAAAQPADAEQPAEPPQEAGADQEEKADEEFEFRLFSTSSKAAAPVKVVLAASDDEDADLGEGAFTVPERPSSYYFAGQPTPEELQMFRQSALAGDDIVLGARKRAWGLERPWRIIRIGGPTKSVKRPSVKGPNVKVATATSIVNEGDEQKRKRPGKKRRIATRVKAKAEKERREAAEKQKMTKEEHLKEKKKRLNREKKLKRRAKEREQKLAGKGQAGSQQTVSNPADSGSDDDSAA